MRFLQSTQIDECRQQIDVGRQPVDIPSARQIAARPANKDRDPVAAIVFGAFLASHPGVVSVTRGTVVGHKNQNRVLLQVQLFQLAHQPGHIVVDIGDHPVEPGLVLR